MGVRMNKSSSGSQSLEKSLLGEPLEPVFSSKEAPTKSNLPNMFRGVFRVPMVQKANPEDRYQAMSDPADDKHPQSKESCVMS